MSRAASVRLYYRDNRDGDILHQEVLVPKAGATPDTYYCMLQWNAGADGSGYCGIQDHAKGNNFIFSLWDPKTIHGIPIKTLYRGKGTEISHFGHEGTGLKSMNYSFLWKPDNWYTTVARQWQVDTHTHFGLWLHNQTDEEWLHMITMDYPVNHLSFSGKTVSFLEDWSGTGTHARTAHFRNGFKRKLDGSWFPFIGAHFDLLLETNSRDHAQNFDVGSHDGYFYMSTGGDVHPGPGVTLSNMYVPIHGHHVYTPSEDPTAFSITMAETGRLLWDVPLSSTPQFSYTVKLNGKQVAHVIDSEDRSFALDAAVGDALTLEVEDILGRKNSHSTTIKE